MTCPLQHLHQQFHKTIHDHTYMGPTKGDPKKLENTRQKTIRFAEVFKIAQEQIKESLKGKYCADIREISHLKSLQHDGSIIYQRYEKSANGWIRTMMKCLARYTPEFLKKILPSCFSNKMEQAEKEVSDAFEDYRKFLKQEIDKLSKASEEMLQEEGSPEKKLFPSPLIDEDGEEIFDPDLDILTEEDKVKQPPKQTTKPKPKLTRKPDPKMTSKPNRPGIKRDPKKEPTRNPEQEKRNQEIREKRLKLFEKNIPDDEDQELQLLLEQIYTLNQTEITPKDASKKDESQKGESQKEESKKEESKKEDSLSHPDLSKLIEELEIFDDVSPEEETLNQPPTASPQQGALSISSPLSEEEQQQAKQQKIDMLSLIIEKSLQLLKNFEERPLSLKALLSHLGNLALCTTALADLDPEGTSALEKLGFDEKTLDTLKDIDFRGAILLGNHEKIAEFLAVTPWQSIFKEALAQKGYITFLGVQKMGGMKLLKLSSDKNLPVKESAVQKYRGQLNIKIHDSKTLTELNDLVAFLETTPNCRPCSIVMTLGQDQAFTPELAQILLKLKDRVAQIEIHSLQEINFKTLDLSEEDELAFVQHLDQFAFPQLAHIVLSDKEKKEWKVQDFANLLAMCPKLDLLKQCYQLCPSYQEIIIPSCLQDIEELDVKGLTLDQAAFLIAHFKKLTHLNLSGLPIKDSQLLDLLKTMNMANIKGLELTGCNELTTDALVVLATLPRLVTLSLPDLPKGKIALDKLPKFDNPFKVKLLYTASKVTQPLAANLYTGPQIWAALFQIPLARLGVKTIFPANQRRIDPKSVAYWLYKGDYKHLTPHENIITVLADSNADLNDDNIVEFMKKFPKALSLSLYNCPNVTSEGIIKLVKECPQLKILDLAECSHITEDLLLGDNHVDILKKLDKIIVSGTGISTEFVSMFQEQGVKLDFVNTILKITDEDLTDAQAFENMLKGKDLTKLKTINLEGCKKLTNEMLGQLLDHLNAPLWITTEDGALLDNPQRLNAAVINIKDCTQITEDAFHEAASLSEKNEEESSKKLEEVMPSKIDLKLLENLNRIVIGGTKIPTLIKDLYPQVIFQDADEPVAIQVDPDLQLAECIAYHEKKAQPHLDKEEDPALRRISEHYVHNRLVVELFHEDQKDAKDVLVQPIDPNSEEFCDITLSFMTRVAEDEENSDITVFHAHRDVLYSQSLYFVNGFRPGGTMSKNQALDILNVHAHPQAAKAIMDLFYGKLNIGDLDWKTAADVAEIIGPHNFKLSPVFYKQLLKRIHDQFDLSCADDMLLVAKELGDDEGKKEYEDTLLLFLSSLEENDLRTFQKIANLAKGHGLTKLKAEVEKLERSKTNKLIQQQMDEQNAENEALTQQMINEIEEERKATSYNPLNLFGFSGWTQPKRKSTSKKY